MLQPVTLYDANQKEIAVSDGLIIPSGAQAIPIAGSDGTNFRFLKTRTDSILYNDQNEEQTFTIAALGVAIGNGKSMLSILNATGSTVLTRVHEIYIVNSQLSAVTGVMANFELHRFTAATAAHSGGTDLVAGGSVNAHDTSNALNASITVRTGATTITTEVANILYRWIWSSDEYGTGTLDQEGLDHAVQVVLPGYLKGQKTMPFILRANAGFTLKQTTNSTAGTFDIIVRMSQV